MSQRFTEKFTLSEEALSQEVCDETVILDLKSENYFGLDEVGTRIWQLLKEQDDLQLIFDALLKEFDVSENQLEGDINHFIDELKSNGLIEIKSAN